MKNTVVFITGTGHSGSTLIDLILGSHSTGFSLGEFSSMPKNLMNGKLNSPICSICGAGCAFWDQKASLPLLEEYFQNGDSKNFFVSQIYGRLGSMRSDIYQHLFKWTESKLLIDSSKSIYWIKRQLRPRWYWKDRSPFLLLIFRDGRAVLNSYIRKYPDLNVQKFTRHWMKLVNEMESFYNAFPADRRAKVSYEKLATEPENVVSKLCDQLNISYEPEMLSYWKHDHHIVYGNARTRSLIQSYRNSENGGDGNDSKLRIHLDMKWKQELMPEQLAMFKTVAGEMSQIYNFESNKSSTQLEPKSSSLPLASVVIVTRNRADSLERTLNAVKALNYDNYEILVVNNGSTDNTQTIIEQQKVRSIYRSSEFGIGSCRQAGVEAAKGEIIAFCDDDCVPNPDWLSRFVCALEKDKELGVVAGQVINIGFNDSMQLKGRSRHIRNGKLSWVDDPNQAEFYGNMNLAFRKETITKIGGYDPFFNVMEEIDLQMRIRKSGHPISYVPDAILTHHHTGKNFKKRHMIPSIPMVRLYLCMKHFQPTNTKEWLSFLGYESKLLADELQRICIGFGGSTIKGEFRRWPELGKVLFQSITSRLAMPWLFYRARRASK